MSTITELRPGLEQRYAPAGDIEVRVKGDTATVEGYAVKWGEKSINLGGFRERIMEGAATTTIAEKARSSRNDIRSMFGHNALWVYARQANGTLEVLEDETGIRYVAQADLRKMFVRDQVANLQDGTVNQSSFIFRVPPGGAEWSFDGDSGFPLRSVHTMELFTVDPVAMPAYLGSTSGVRAALRSFLESQDLEGEELERAQELLEDAFPLRGKRSLMDALTEFRAGGALTCSTPDGRQLYLPAGTAAGTPGSTVTITEPDGTTRSFSLAGRGALEPADAAPEAPASAEGEQRDQDPEAGDAAPRLEEALAQLERMQPAVMSHRE